MYSKLNCKQNFFNAMLQYFSTVKKIKYIHIYMRLKQNSDPDGATQPATNIS